MSIDIDITIVGGGIVGTALAYELSKRGDRSICLIEKNETIKGENQSSRASGVVHAGIYYPSDKEPLKAKLCVEGNRLLYAFCEMNRIPCARTGKLVVAVEEYEEEYLDDLLKTSRENGVRIQKISANEARKLEPNVDARCALHVPDSGIVEPTLLTEKLYQISKNNGAMCLTGTKVIKILPGHDGFEVVMQPLRGEQESFTTGIILNAAGLYADDVARLFHKEFQHTVQPVRGESAKFYKNIRPGLFTRMNVYPAPYGYANDTGVKAKISFGEFQKLLDEKKITRTVGVHLTPTFDIADAPAENGGSLLTKKYIVGNTVTIGPVKTVGIEKEDYAQGLKPEHVYLDAVKGFFPNLQLADIGLHQAGIMAVPAGQRDFIIERDTEYPQAVHLIIDSPGLTACLAIARHVSEKILTGI